MTKKSRSTREITSDLWVRVHDLEIAGHFPYELLREWEDSMPSMCDVPSGFSDNSSATWEKDSKLRPDDAMHGSMLIWGCDFHVTAIRVVTNDEGYQRPVDLAFEPEYEHALDINGDGPFTTVNIPGHEGDYVLIIYPFAD